MNYCLLASSAVIIGFIWTVIAVIVLDATDTSWHLSALWPIWIGVAIAGVPVILWLLYQISLLCTLICKIRERRRRTDPEMAVRIDEGPRANQIYIDVTPRPLPTILIARHHPAPPKQPEHKDSEIGSDTDVTPPATDNDAEEKDTSPPDQAAVPTGSPLTDKLTLPEPERQPSGTPEDKTAEAVIPGDFPSTIAPRTPVGLPQ